MTLLDADDVGERRDAGCDASDRGRTRLLDELLVAGDAGGRDDRQLRHADGLRDALEVIVGLSARPSAWRYY